MKLWMLPWLLPVGLLGAVVFVVVAGRYAALIAVAVGLVLLPVLWRLHFPSTDEDADSHYWRIKAP
jgi:hypothetical protein